MKGHYFKFAWRSLWTNKLFTLINIIGLSIGMSSCWVIYQLISYELSYEKGVPNKEHTYRLLSKIQIDENQEARVNGGVSRPIYFALKEELASSERVVAVFREWTTQVQLPDREGRQNRIIDFDIEKGEDQIMATDSAYFTMLPYTWLAGNKTGALNQPQDVVLTETRAKLYFPDVALENIIGKTILYPGQDPESPARERTITGIVAELPFPSEFKGQEFILLEKRERDNRLAEWTNTNGQDRVYIQTAAKQQAESLLTQIQQLTASKAKQFFQEVKPNYNYTRMLELMPLQDSHFSTSILEPNVDKTSKAVVYGLVALGGFLLIIACINYINLTTAQMPLRHKEIGIRKTMGSSQKALIVQFLSETLLISLIAMILSFFLSKLGLQLLGDLVKPEAQKYIDPIGFVLFLAALIASTTLLSGLYPAWLITRVKPVNIFRDQLGNSSKSTKTNLRRVLIIFQFVLAQFFIVGAILVGLQLKYTSQKDLGFNKDAVILSDLPFKLYAEENFDGKKSVLLEEIKQIPGVISASLGNPPLEEGYRSSVLDYKDANSPEPVSTNVYLKYVDTAYMKLYDIALIAGTPLPVSDTTSAYILNETAVHAFGFSTPEQAIGKFIGQEGYRYPIVGVVKDFHQQDFHQAIDPMALLTDRSSGNTYNIKLDQARRKNWPESIAAIQAKWKSLFPNAEFNYNFYDQSIAALYKKEQQLAQLTNLCTAIAILISCLGLFGLATLTALQRNKEIGIRKVLGASVKQIVGLLSVDFLRIVLIAILIASPLIWWAVSRWLEDFVYRIEIGWVPFLLGGSIALLAALLTISYQAIKAAKSNPVNSLREQ